MNILHEILSPDFLEYVNDNAEELDSLLLDFSFDYNMSYLSFLTVHRSYLLKFEGKPIERPSHMLLRVAVAVHYPKANKIREMFLDLSAGRFIHATPTLYSAGLKMQQMSSCFLLTMQEDSIQGIYNTLGKCALISKSAGGIGLDFTPVRASGSYVKGTGGMCNGIIPALKVFNESAVYVDQGGQKRPGSWAIYLEPWHLDVEDFLQLRLNQGVEKRRARELFYAIWTPDLFMKRVEADADWSLFCPNDTFIAGISLHELWGSPFDAHYEKLESSNVRRKTIRARSLWEQICKAQSETGLPYILFKDSCNAKSNQQNLGTIHCSNLCTEIVEYTSKDEIAVCNLASIALPKFVIGGEIKWKEIDRVTHDLVENLNKIIDWNRRSRPC
jgi:ribonucleoside-diphosphate reductase alpha subunit